MTTFKATQHPGGVKERIPLSFNQEFLCMFDKDDGEGPFGPKYNIVCGWRVRGKMHLDALQAALDDVVERHETLRTKIVRDGDAAHQEVFAPSSAEVLIRDLPGTPFAERDRRAEELLIELESGAYGIADLPLIRLVLARFDESDAVLVIVAHHSAVDEWSMQLMIRDLANRYAVHRGLEVPALPETRPYREYAVWERNLEIPARARSYWRQKLDGAQIATMRTDHPRSAALPKGTSAHRFLIDARLTAPVLDLAKTTHSSPFMVLLAAYKVYLRSLTGATDLTVPTLASGRTQAKFHETVGSFFNFVPLRTDLAGCRTFTDVLTKTRRTCIEAYSHDMPFAMVVQEAPALMAPLAGDDQAIFAFQVHQFPFVMNSQRIGDLEYSDIRRRLLSQEVSTDIPDGALWTLAIDPDGDIIGNLGFNNNLFTEKRVVEISEGFRQVLSGTVTSPDSPLPKF